jgi:hypothetical protein
MPTPAAVEPPTPENVHLYRAAVLAWRKAEIEERSKHADIKLAKPHAADHSAARAVHELAPEMTYAQAFLLAEKVLRRRILSGSGAASLTTGMASRFSAAPSRRSITVKFYWKHGKNSAKM